MKRLVQTLCMIVALASAGMAQEATITIQADKLGAPVAKSLYGLFFEEINHAGDGGLYAELIQNRSFDETLPVEGCTVHGDQCVAPNSPQYLTGRPKNWSVPWKFSSPHPAWSLENPGSASLSIETERALNASNTTYLRMAASAEGARLLNEGYWGISVKAGESYDLSFFARRQGQAVKAVRVGLIDPAGKVLASQEIALTAGNWKQYSCTFTASGSDPKARFFLQTLSAGTLDLDVVSLFPRKTFKDRPNGCREDLAQLLADLKPAFLRFPGGCVVEGATMENRWQWKKTIGPIHERPGHWSLWGYRNTDGLGYHEFLQLCEDIGAQGMLVVNCGLSCEYRNGDYWPDDRIPALVQDTLDAIEYAIGPVDSKWGSLRAKAGHPEPLPLKYIEIGNENHGPKYIEIYKRFAPVIKKAYPQLTLICNVKLEGAEMEDPHFYVAPPFFFENFGRFDKAPRVDPSGTPSPRVYVGEFAVNRDVGRGSLLAALSEAVFMMGMERNGDLVTMASYAPLLFNVNRLDWPVNMIGFDSAVSFGRTSYYGQKMFATNMPDVNVACEFTAPPMAPSARTGMVGVGTWATQAEYKDIKVIDPSGKTLFESSADKPMAGLKPVSGRWSIVDGALRQVGDESGTRAVAGDRRWREYTLSLKACKLSGAEGFLIMFGTNERDKSWWNVGGWGNREHGLEVGGIDAPRVAGRIETGRWYDIRVELSDQRIRCLLDGKVIHDVERKSNLSSLYAIAGKQNGNGELIVKVVNAASRPQATRINIAGAKSIAPQARLLVMSHTDQSEENSVESPTKIAPVESTLDVAGPRFTHIFPANSITVMRIRP